MYWPPPGTMADRQPAPSPTVAWSYLDALPVPGEPRAPMQRLTARRTREG